MRNDAGILIAENNDERYLLMERNLCRSGVTNDITRFTDGQAAIDFLTGLKDSSNPHAQRPWLMILNIQLPTVGGFEVLKTIKDDPFLKIIPVLVIAAEDDQAVADQCHAIGCNIFIIQSAESEAFMELILQIGRFLSIVEIPALNQ